MGDLLDDKRRWRVWDTAQQARIEDKRTGTRIRCVGSDPRRAHGLAPVLVLADEGAQWPPSTGDRVVAALRTAAGKQPFCRFVAIGTRPADESHWFARLLDGGADSAQVHAADPDDPPFRKRTWIKANPSLPYMPNLEAAIRREAANAKRDESAMQSFRALRLNQGTSDVQVSVLLEASTWRRITGDVPREGRPVLGWDFGQSEAMAACAAYWPASGRLEALASFPREPGLAERGTQDGVGDLYLRMATRGELVLTGGEAVNLAEFVELARERFGVPAAMALDRWRATEARDIFRRVGLGAVPLAERGMGFRDGAEDVRGFRRACVEGKVSPAPSLLLTAAMAEARTVSDPAGNAKLAKATQGGRRRRAKDDAAAAAILAVAYGSRRARRPNKPAWRYAGMAG